MKSFKTKSLANLVFAFIFLFASSVAYADQDHAEDSSDDAHGEHSHVEEGHENEFNASEMIMHHIGDANEFHVIGNENTSINFSVPLPVILWDKAEGLKVMLSSAFHHGHTAVDGYVLDHGIVKKIVGDFPEGHVEVEVHHGEVIYDGHHYTTEGKSSLLASTSFFDFSITKNVFSMFLSMLILFIIFISMARFYKKGNQVPTGIYNALEPFIIYVRDEIAIDNIGKKKAGKFLPLLLTIFFFIWINNLLGLVPFFPGSANLTGNIAFTFVLSVIVMLVVNLNGTKDYWGHMLWMPGIPTPMKLLMAPIELVGIIKPFSLLVRLFANITAGHILILSLVSLIFIFNNIGMSAMSIPFMLFINALELLVAFLQAYIFTLLTALFIGMAVAEHEHH
ncbi:MAG: F0F1 ATP synthase subunit A [Chitinophagales bacterium]